MLKLAYQLGIKIALEEAGIPAEVGIPGENSHRGNGPAEQLVAALLQQVPDEDNDGLGPPNKAIGDPEQSTSYGSRSANYAFDDLSHLGLDIQGPTSTAV